MFWITVKTGDQVYRAVLDTGATLSIVARRMLKQARIQKTKTVAIRVGDGRTIHSLKDVDVTVCMGDEQVTQHCKVLDSDAFDIVIRTDFLRRNSKVKVLSSQAPYALHCDLGSGLFSVPLELSGRKESDVRYAKPSYRTENYPFVRPVLENGLAARGTQDHSYSFKNDFRKHLSELREWRIRIGQPHGFPIEAVGVIQIP